MYDDQFSCILVSVVAMVNELQICLIKLLTNIDNLAFGEIWLRLRQKKTKLQGTSYVVYILCSKNPHFRSKLPLILPYCPIKHTLLKVQTVLYVSFPATMVQ